MGVHLVKLLSWAVLWVGGAGCWAVLKVFILVKLLSWTTSWADAPDIGRVRCHGWGELDVGRVRLWVFDIVELLSGAASWAGRAGCWVGDVMGV